LERTTDRTSAAPDAGLAPRANPDLLGHEAAEEELGRLYGAGRLPHAILLAGPRGIGKATLAFRLARWLLAEAEPAARTGVGLGADPESGVFRRVAAGGHADLLTVERTWDPRRRRLRGDIVVDDARAIGAFFRLTAAEEGWRIVVVDGAEEMSRSAGNALLKILEEPPSRGLLLLVSHSPARLLPTVRSRCRRLRLDLLPPDIVERLLRDRRPDLSAQDGAAVASLAEGSIGRAIELADAGGAALYRALLDLLAPAPRLDAAALHALADRLCRPEAEAAYRGAEELLSQLLARTVSAAVGRSSPAKEAVAGEAAAMARLAGRAAPSRWAALRGEIEVNFLRVGALNLDRKQAMLDAFFAIAATAR
jgi:DNA polymerase-3 subunit delta'